MWLWLDHHNTTENIYPLTQSFLLPNPRVQSQPSANIPGGNCFGASIRFQSIITAPEPSRTMLVSLLFGSVPPFLILSLCLNGRSSQKLKQSRVSAYLRRDTNFFLNLSILLPLFSNIFRNMILGDNLSFFFSCCDWPLYAAKLVCGSKNKV